MKATILYQSKKGRTAGWARAMAMYLWSKGVNVSYGPISDFKEEQLRDSDLLLLGSWTTGWFVVNQNPSKVWIEASKKLPATLPPHLVLFATYKVRTGAIFKRMKGCLNLSDVKQVDTMKSKTGILSDEDKQRLDAYIERIKALRNSL